MLKKNKADHQLKVVLSLVTIAVGEKDFSMELSSTV